MEQLVNHYRLIEKLGAGGMGEVYLAEDSKLKRNVALKFLPPGYSADPDFKARFKHEAQATAALNHPHIITVYDISEHEGRLFLVLEHVSGRTLQEVIESGKLNLSEALDLVSQICEGLASAHKAGIVHRDIKPSNILISDEGQAKILDFGLAKMSGVTKLTKEGSTLGTLQYQSPEQSRGETVDERSDIFSVGVTLYEMITGHLPFEGDYDQAVRYSISYESPEPLARYKSGVSDDLQRIVDKALSKDPEHRYQHADEMLADLKRLNSESRLIGKRKIRPWIALTAGLVIAFAGYFAVDQFVLSEPKAGGKWSNSIAVLVFRDQSPEQDQDYFCEGMTDAIIGRLSGINELKVISLTSVLSYKTPDRDLTKIGRELGVATILEGSIQREDDRIRIRAQLIDVEEDAHLWTDYYDSELKSVFAVQDDISRAIVEVMKIQLMGEEETALTKHGTENVEAYSAYSQGRYFWRKRTEDGIRKAIDHFEHAIALDSTFTLAYSGLADSYAIFADYGGTTQFEVARSWRDTALGAALTAVRLDDKLAEAHTSLGLVHYKLGEFKNSEREYLRAIELNPGYVWVHIWYGSLLATESGRRVDQTRELVLALELDPLSIVALGNLAELKTKAQEYEEAETLYLRILEITPENKFYKYQFANFLVTAGKKEEAFDQFERLIDLNPRTWNYYWVYAKHLSDAGESDRATQLWQKAIAAYPNDAGVYASYGNYLHFYLRDYSEAIVQSNRALEIDPGLAQAYNQLAYSYDKVKNPEKAMWAVNRAIELAPENAEYFDSKGELCLWYGLLDSSITAYRRCLELAPNRLGSVAKMARAAIHAQKYELADSLSGIFIDHESPKQRARGRSHRAGVLLHQGKFREATRLLRDGLKVDQSELGESRAPTLFGKHWVLMDIYKYYVRDFELSLEITKKHRAFVLTTERQDQTKTWIQASHGSLAFIYARGGDFLTADQWLDSLKNALDTSKKDGLYLIDFYQGVVALEKRDFEEAVTHFNKAGGVVPNTEGAAYLGAGRFEEAVAVFEREASRKFRVSMIGWQYLTVWAHYGLGMAYEADGQMENAIEQYETFLDIWKNADAGLESLEDARMRLARLRDERKD